MKQKLLLLGTILLIAITSGCSDQKETKTTYSTNTIESVSVGSYILWETDNSEEYLNFLSNFDYEAYEIVNIDTFIRETNFKYNDDYFMITYRRIK